MTHSNSVRQQSALMTAAHKHTPRYRHAHFTKATHTPTHPHKHTNTPHTLRTLCLLDPEEQGLAGLAVVRRQEFGTHTPEGAQTHVQTLGVFRRVERHQALVLEYAVLRRGHLDILVFRRGFSGKKDVRAKRLLAVGRCILAK